MKLRTKLMAAFIVIVFLMGISQSLFLQKQISATFEDYLQNTNIGFMERLKQALELYYEETGSWADVQDIYFSGGMGPGMMMHGAGMGNIDYLLLDNDGKVIADSAGTRIGQRSLDIPGKEQDIIINGEKKGTLIFHQNQLQELERQFLRSSNLAILTGGLIAAFLAVLISLWIARRITSPLSGLMKGINRIASGEKVPKVRVSTKDEFHELGEAFNEMAGRLERNEEARRALVADVAHELRTPLAILQGKLESIQEGAIIPSEETILELTDEVYRLNRLVKDLQQLSLAEAGKLPLNMEPVAINQFIGRVCGHLDWLADEKGILLSYNDIPDDLMIELDPDRMAQVIVNLVGNALRHTEIHGQVKISAMEQEDRLIIKVADTGEGIPEEELPFIFDRFYKRDPSRTRSESGTGLGLSIAKGFIESHGGSISVESRKGQGTTFTIVLPRKGREGGD